MSCFAGLGHFGMFLSLLREPSVLRQGYGSAKVHEADSGVRGLRCIVLVVGGGKE